MALNPQLVTKPEEDPTLHSNHLRPTLFSPSTHRSWIASATIRRWLPAGQTLKPRTAYAQHCAPTWGSRLGWRYVPGQPYQSVMDLLETTGRSGARSSRTLCVLYTILPADFRHPFMLRLSCHARQPGVILPSRRNRCSSAGKNMFHGCRSVSLADVFFGFPV